ncbi:MAG: WG repeat-containing protein [Microcoleus sp. SIO2G3]|nr:WG repeat-containing protein [Microcoleus sp. SIO2G3]
MSFLKKITKASFYVRLFLYRLPHPLGMFGYSLLQVRGKAEGRNFVQAIADYCNKSGTLDCEVSFAMKTVSFSLIFLSVLLLTSSSQPINARQASETLPITENSRPNITSDTGKLVIPAQFDEAHSFSQGLAAVKLGSKWGFIDKTGKLVIPLQFESVGYAYENDSKTFFEGLAAVSVAEKWGYIDKTGKFVIQPQFESARSFSEGLANVWINRKSGFIDKTGKFVIQPQFDGALNFSEGLAVVNRGGKTGYIDKTGKFIIKAQFDNAESFQNGQAKVWIGETQRCIDKTGKFIQLQFNDCGMTFSEGLAVVNRTEEPFLCSERGQCNIGYIDKTEKIVIEPKFSRANNFAEGLAAVATFGGHDPALGVLFDGWGYIDKAGEMVIPAEYRDARSFSEGLAAVKVGNKWGYISR